MAAPRSLKPSAASRTVPLFDDAAQANATRPFVELDGGWAYKVMLHGTGRVSRPPQTHLVAHYGDYAALCDEPLCGPKLIDEFGEAGEVCQACLAVASQRRMQVARAGAVEK